MPRKTIKRDREINALKATTRNYYDGDARKNFSITRPTEEEVDLIYCFKIASNVSYRGDRSGHWYLQYENSVTGQSNHGSAAHAVANALHSLGLPRSTVSDLALQDEQPQSRALIAGLVGDTQGIFVVEDVREITNCVLSQNAVVRALTEWVQSSRPTVVFLVDSASEPPLRSSHLPAWIVIALSRCKDKEKVVARIRNSWAMTPKELHMSWAQILRNVAYTKLM